MTKKRKITTVVAIVILVAAVIFAVTRFFGGGSGGIDNVLELIYSESYQANLMERITTNVPTGQKMSWIMESDLSYQSI